MNTARRLSLMVIFWAAPEYALTLTPAAILDFHDIKPLHPLPVSLVVRRIVGVTS